jgi:two-component system phosphate regulon sensor histidine kinase PhoR
MSIAASDQDRPIDPFEAAQRFTTITGAILELDRLKPAVVNAVASAARCETVILLLLDDDAALRVEAISGDVVRQPRDMALPTFNRDDDPMVSAWKAGIEYKYTRPAESPEKPTTADDLALTLKLPAFLGVPLMYKDRWIGALVASNSADKSLPDGDVLRMIAVNAGVAIHNARIYSDMMKELQAKNDELRILNQIDRELTETIKIDHVFDMTLDWAIRSTRAQAAALMLYDEAKDEMRLSYEIGYAMPMEQLADIIENDGGIAQRVARSGFPEIIPDVSADHDYVMLSSEIRSHMSVPVRREEKVIAVIAVESRRLNNFTDQHQQFVEKLAVRAGVAIDNARLFADSVREREKLSHILSNIADVVIVVGYDDRLILVNQSAIAAFRLYTDRSYVNEVFSRVFGETSLNDVYQQAKRLGYTLSREVGLHGRTYYSSLSQLENIGWIIVMHDITPLKETEQLKSELLQTVSHDLKQPLSIMNGYIELMQIQNRLDETGMRYSNAVMRSIENMRRLIDDLLDFAKIETGIQLKLRPVSVFQIINDCVQSIMPMAESKAMIVEVEVTTSMPPVHGDPDRLHQIFSNLIGNAVKYTPPEGKVRIWAEVREGGLVVAIEDTGIGIAPEDQAKIFDRFYRVRRIETETIEGTGLGLAIVKKLVDLHQGNIGLESRLGEGTTFYVTLPIMQTEGSALTPAV